eukprot:11969956-Alexandrium_andersonii.AAC.1
MFELQLTAAAREQAIGQLRAGLEQCGRAASRWLTLRFCVQHRRHQTPFAGLARVLDEIHRARQSQRAVSVLPAQHSRTVVQ